MHEQRRGPKSGVTDDAFLARMQMQCRDDEERGMVYILFYTGMHGISLQSLTEANLTRQGDKTYLRWRRPKNDRFLEAQIPSDKLPFVKAFLNAKRKKSFRWHNYLLHKMGQRAGYDDVSTMTFRHTRCIRLLLEDTPMPVVAQLMGCTEEVVHRAYGKLTEEQKREVGSL